MTAKLLTQLDRKVARNLRQNYEKIVRIFFVKSA